MIKSLKEILKYINELLSDYQSYGLNKISRWTTCKEISKLTGKTKRTIQRAARAKKFQQHGILRKKWIL